MAYLCNSKTAKLPRLGFQETGLWFEVTSTQRILNMIIFSLPPSTIQVKSNDQMKNYDFNSIWNLDSHMKKTVDHLPLMKYIILTPQELLYVLQKMHFENAINSTKWKRKLYKLTSTILQPWKRLAYLLIFCVLLQQQHTEHLKGICQCFHCNNVQAWSETQPNFCLKKKKKIDLTKD